MWGIDNTTIKTQYGAKTELHFLNEITKWEAKKYVVANTNVYTLTSSGKAFADAIASDLFIV